jgi:hypothetical protein
MKDESFLDFIEAFEKLSPFDLDYFTKIFCTHFNEHELVQESKLSQLTAINLKDILIKTMRAAHVDVAERKVREAQRGLDLTRSRVYLAATPESTES